MNRTAERAALWILIISMTACATRRGASDTGGSSQPGRPFVDVACWDGWQVLSFVEEGAYRTTAVARGADELPVLVGYSGGTLTVVHCQDDLCATTRGHRFRETAAFGRVRVLTSGGTAPVVALAQPDALVVIRCRPDDCSEFDRTRTPLRHAPV